jgi:alkylhydroperoxidase family enzyme
VRDVDAAALDSTDRAIVDFAAKIALHADQVTASDIDDLRAVGLSDEEVFDVVLAAAIRCFFSKALDGTGTQPDHEYMALDVELRDTLTVGRPIEAP